MTSKGRLSFFFSSRRRHTRCYRDWSSECALPICEEVAQRAAERVAAGRAGQGGMVGVQEDDDRRQARVGCAENPRQAGEGVPKAVGGAPERQQLQIGRASCRERGEIAGGARTVEE